MSFRNGTIRFLLGLFMILSLQLHLNGQTTDSAAVSPETRPVKAEPFPGKTGTEPEDAPETEKPNNKIVAAVCLIIITTTLLLYHVRSK